MGTQIGPAMSEMPGVSLAFVDFPRCCAFSIYVFQSTGLPLPPAKYTLSFVFQPAGSPATASAAPDDVDSDGDDRARFDDVADTIGQDKSSAGNQGQRHSIITI